MDASEFWCRAFLVAMDEHDDLERCEEIANAALWRAQRLGMVTGERAAQTSEIEALRNAGLRWLNALRENNVDASESAERDLLRAAEALDRGQAGAKSELERVEFTAEKADHGQWDIQAEAFGVVRVRSEQESVPINWGRVRIQWAETMPPKPAEVWIEKAGA